MLGVQNDADIEVFEVLLEVANKHNLRQTPWAKAAWPEMESNPQSRISELKRILLTMKRKGISQEEASVIVKRRCTWDKMFALGGGMMTILGEKVTRKELKEARKKVKGIESKIFLNTLILDKKGQQTLLQLSNALVDAMVDDKD